MRSPRARGLGNLFTLSAFSAVLSNLIRNVPAVLVFKPLLAHVANPTRAWLALAMSSTLAGNLTVLGPVANLIVIQQSRGAERIGFWEYCRAGAPFGNRYNSTGSGVALVDLLVALTAVRDESARTNLVFAGNNIGEQGI